MNMATPSGLLVAGLLLWSCNQTASAATSCGYSTAARPFNGNMALNVGSLSVPRDVPIGTRLYMQEFHQAGEGVTFTCTTDRTSPVTTYNVFSVNGLGSKVDANNAGGYAGKVYATGVPGIGVSWWSGQTVPGAVGAGSNTLQIVPNGCVGTGNNCQTAALKVGPRAALVLIKTGPVGTGTVRGSDFGRLVYSTVVETSTAFAISEVGVTGSINVVAMTCNTPDVTVPMGSHKTSTLTGVGSGTPRVDFKIEMTNCPGFPGYYGNPGTGAIPAASQTAVTNAGTRVLNTVSFRVDPVTTPVDAANGVLSLTSGAGTATGVGVQLFSISGAVQPLSQNRVLNISPAAGTTGFSVDLSARYLQTADKVTAGKANAVANYTLIYQ
ncbi:fimbrial protein [Pseudomonas frederiksbergensis]|uniref:fimbrial protein n=1 Tax=Pseudomonas frederiksbergensis TaxID=104087 RepID=UPI003D02EB96